MSILCVNFVVYLVREKKPIQWFEKQIDKLLELFKELLNDFNTFDKLL